jgi:hypothetical protein
MHDTWSPVHDVRLMMHSQLRTTVVVHDAQGSASRVVSQPCAASRDIGQRSTADRSQLRCSCLRPYL